MRNALFWFITHFALFYSAALIAFVFIGIVVSRKKISVLIQTGRVEIITILVLATGTWVAAQFFVTHTHNVYYDEYRHIRMAEVLADTGVYGVVENPDGKLIPDQPSIKWPPAFHTLLAFLFLIGGPSEKVAYCLNPILAALSIIAAWLYARLLSFGPRPTLIGVTMLAAWPLLMRMAGGVSLEVGAMFAVLLSSALLIAYLKSGSKQLFFTAVAAVGLAGLFRLEAIGIALIVPFACAVFERKKSEEVIWPGTNNIFIGLLFLAPAVLTALSGFGIYSGFREQVGRNPFFDGMSFWLGGELMPYTTVALAVLGFIFFLRTRKAISFSLLAIIVFMVLIVTFYVGVSPAKADSQRYQLLCAPALVGLCAGGVLLLEKLTRRSKYGFPVLFLACLLGASINMKNAQTPFNPALEKEYRLIQQSGIGHTQGAKYFCAIPDQLSSTLGIDAGQARWLVEPTRYAADDFSKKRIYFRDLRATNPKTPGFYELDRKITDKYNLKKLSVIRIDDRPVGFYELVAKQK